VEGEFEAGSRLPTRSNLLEHYQTTPVTIQRVFDRLAADGFVEAHGRAGTFVCDQPPHLGRYVIFFPPRQHVGSELDSILWQAMINQGNDLAKANGRRVEVFDWSDAVQDAAKNLEFTNSVLEHQVAGLIFPSHPAYFLDLPVMHVKGIPRVALMSKAIPGRVLAVRMGGPYVQRALDHLKAEGRSRLAVLGTPGWLTDEKAQTALDGAVSERGMTCPARWRQAVDISGSVAADHLTRLLFDGNPGDRPDAYLILDDNLVEPATRGLAASNLSILGDVTVIAHANFPEIAKAHVPVTRLGYDIREILRLCMELIDKQRSGEEVSECTELSPVFEHELT
jgi:DNA-binding LacI/PurR family transcriptional regulator